VKKRILAIGWLAAGAAGAAQAVLPDDLVVGTRVDLEGTRSGAEVAADHVELLRPRAGSDRIEGAIEQVDAAARSLLVAGVRVVLGPGAVVRDGDGREIGLEGMGPGQEAEVAGRFENGALRATSLEVDELEGDEARQVEIEGAVAELDPAGNAFRVLGLRVQITPRTKVRLD
jgi:hypothetical protein